MNWAVTHRRSAWICGCTLLIPLALYVYALVGAWSPGRGYQADIDSLTPRIARLRGLGENEEQLRDASTGARKAIDALAYPAVADVAAVSAALQTDIRQLVSEAGLSVSNSQLLPVITEGRFDYIPMRLTLEGDLSGLDEALSGLAQFKPLLLVESLDIAPLRAARKEAASQRMRARIQVFALKVAQ